MSTYPTDHELALLRQALPHIEAGEFVVTALAVKHLLARIDAEKARADKAEELRHLAAECLARAWAELDAPEAVAPPSEMTPDEGVDVLVQDERGAMFTAVYYRLDDYGVWWPHARPGEDIPADWDTARERGDAPVVRWWPLPHGAAPIPGWPSNPDALDALGPEVSSDPGQLPAAPEAKEPAP